MIRNSESSTLEFVQANNPLAEQASDSGMGGTTEVATSNRIKGNGRTTVFIQSRSRLRNGRDPEIRELTFSFLPLSDAAPFLVAQFKGLFEDQGITATLRMETNWTAVRDSLNQGLAHAAQMLFGMPVAANCGLLGANQKPLVVPWVLSRNGQAITLKKSHSGQVKEDARALRDPALAGRDSGRPLVFGHTLRIGTHAMWLRYWLAAGGIDPVQDVALITVPPPQMVRNMRGSAMDGFCVGEPWNARAVAEGAGFTAITSQQIWPDHPEKVCAFTEEFARENPRTVVAVLKALYRAGVWLDNPDNHDEAARLLAGADFLNCDESWIRSRFSGTVEFGDDREAAACTGVNFSKRGANCPRKSHALWFLSQLHRWGLHFGVPDYMGISSRVIRPDFYEQALEELGVQPAPVTDRPETLFDGITFDPAEPGEYARSFKINNLQG